MPLQPTARPRRLRAFAAEALLLVGLALAVVALERLCLTLPRGGSRAAPLWLPNAVVLASLIRSAPARWPARLAVLALAGCATAVSTGSPLRISALLHALSVGEVLFVAAALHVHRRLAPPRDEFDALLRLATASVAASLIGGGIAAALISVLEGRDPAGQFLVWALAHASGLLVLTPCLLTLWRAPVLLKERWVTWRAAAAVLLVLVTAAGVFSQHRAPILFLIPPALIWLTLELEVLGGAIGILIVAAVALASISLGTGPQALMQDPLQRAAVLQLFIVTCMAATLPVAFLTARRRRLTASLKEARDAAEADGRAARTAEALARAAQVSVAESEARYRLVAEKVSDAIARFDLEGRFTFLTPSIASVTGWMPDEMLGRRAREFIHRDDYPAVEAAIAEIAAGRRAPGAPLHYRFRHKDGRTIWLEVNPQVVRDERGRPVGFVDVARDVTDRKLLEARVAESEALHRHISEHAGDIIMRVRAGGALEYISPAVTALAGWAPEEMVGRAPREFVHPDDVAMVSRVFRSLAAGRRAAGQTVEYRLLCKGGGFVWIQGKPQLVRGADPGEALFIDVARDVTERRALEARLAASEALHRQIAEHASDVITRTRMGGPFEYVSPSITAVAGWTPEELVGHTPREFVHPADIDGLSAAFTELAAGRRPAQEALEYRFRRKEGGWVWIQSNPRIARDPASGGASYFDVARDVTARRAMEFDLREARAAAEAAAAVKAEFLANMSHELRTPLTAVLGFSGLVAQQPDLSVTSRSHLERVRSAGKALLTTINDILDFSKLEAGQVEITPGPVDVGQLARETLDLFAVQAKPKDLGLILEGMEALPPLIEVDADRLRQILLNLVGNAVKFTERGSVLLRLSHAGSKLRAEVADTGPGMSTDAQALLFQRFAQVDGSFTRRHGGTGLGLAICKGLVEAMGGVISVYSEPGMGSVFSFTVKAPVGVGAQKAPPVAAPLELSGSVLVADDNAANRELARAALTRLGLEVTEARDGLEAVQAAAVRAFDAVLLDLRMPLMDGVAAARAIRSGGGPTADAPLLAFSAEPAGADRDLWSGVVAKPVSFADLTSAMARVLRADDAVDTSPQTHAA